MTDTVEKTQDQLDDEAYLDAFNEVNSEETPSADKEFVDDDGVVYVYEEESPDDKTPDTDGADASSDKGNADDANEEEEDDPYAWINNLSEEEQKHAKALQHLAVSDAGRVASLRRRVSDAEARLTANKASQAKARVKAPADSTATTEDKELSPKLKDFTEKYPELASSVQEMVNQDRTDIEDMINQRIQPFQEEATYRKVTEARDRLEDGASELFNTPTTDVHYSEVLKSDFYKEEFLKSQPLEFQEVAATTTDPDTALWVLKQFKTFAEQYAIDNDLMEEDGEDRSSAADKTREKRSKKKAAAGTPASRSAVTDPEETLNYEAYFKRINS